VADVLPKFPSRRLPTRRSVAGRIEPALGLRLTTFQQGLEPGDSLEFEYGIQRISAQMIDRLEVSVAWYTEGKGSEDIGVHYFESHERAELSKTALSQPRRLSVKLPMTPLSFEGKLFKIRWCIRLRLFLADGREKTAEQRFYLGSLTSEV
jgi:hypothetical protein